MDAALPLPSFLLRCKLPQPLPATVHVQLDTICAQEGQTALCIVQLDTACAQEGQSALWIAALHKQTPCMELLLGKGADSGLIPKVRGSQLSGDKAGSHAQRQLSWNLHAEHR